MSKASFELKARKPPEELLSLARLSRQLDISYSRALVLYTNGTLRPDFTADRNFFFRASNLPSIKATVDHALGSTQVFNEVDNIMERVPNKKL